jgi:dihydroneopterin triphosphate diphosphatase
MYKTPISVLILIHTPDLHVLLLERADKAGFWQSVTGSLEGAETPQQAATRELFEETGLDARQYQLTDWQLSHVYAIYPHWRHRYVPGITQNTEHIFGLELPEKLAVKLAPDEHVRYRWLDWRAAAVQVFSWTNVEAIRALGKRKELVL